MKRSVAAFPGSFDPFTVGHLDVLNRGLELFDEINIYVNQEPKSSPLFSLDQRVSLVSEIAKGYGDKVRVFEFSGLIVDALKEDGTRLLLRGIRNSRDADKESVMAHYNSQLGNGVETVFLASRLENLYVSGSAVREIVRNGGDASSLVPEAVAEKLKSLGSTCC